MALINDWCHLFEWRRASALGLACLLGVACPATAQTFSSDPKLSTQSKAPPNTVEVGEVAAQRDLKGLLVAAPAAHFAVDSILRVELPELAKFDSVGTSIRTKRVLLVVVRPKDFQTIWGGRAAPDPIWIFNHALVEMPRFDFERLILMMPDPGHQLATSVLMSIDPLTDLEGDMDRLTPSWVSNRLAELRRNETGTKRLVPTEILAPRRLENIDELPVLMDELLQRK